MFCGCGCGNKTIIASRTDTRIGKLKGHPMRFIPGHRARLQRKSQLLYIAEDRGYKTPCLIWQRALDGKGYGQQWDYERHRVRQAHILSFEKARGAIPEGMQLDHLCRQRPCINPEHLEIVTNAENTKRGAKAKLTYEQTREIISLRQSGVGLQAIADKFGVHNATVSRIAHGLRWA